MTFFENTDLRQNERYLASITVGILGFLHRTFYCEMKICVPCVDAEYIFFVLIRYVSITCNILC